MLSRLRTRFLVEPYWLKVVRMFFRVPAYPGARYTPRRLANLYLARWEMFQVRKAQRSTVVSNQAS